MKLSVKIINWVMLVFGVLAVIGLAGDSSLDPDGYGMLISLLWITQSVLNLVYVNKENK